MLKGRRSISQFLEDKGIVKSSVERKRLVVSDADRVIKDKLRSEIKYKLKCLLQTKGFTLHSTKANKLFNEWYCNSSSWVATKPTSSTTNWLRRSTKVLTSYHQWLESNCKLNK
jgi:hypothetical protein